MTDIITSNVYPPIPVRDHDWCAYHDNDVEDGSRYGWGATEAEAVADLARLDAENADALNERDLRERAAEGDQEAIAALGNWLGG